MRWGKKHSGVGWKQRGDELSWDEPLYFRQVRYDFESVKSRWWKRPVAVTGVLAGMATHFTQAIFHPMRAQEDAWFFLVLVLAAVVFVYGERGLMRWFRSHVVVSMKGVRVKSGPRGQNWATKKIAHFRILPGRDAPVLMLALKGKEQPVFIGMPRDEALWRSLRVVLRAANVRDGDEIAPVELDQISIPTTAAKR